MNEQAQVLFQSPSVKNQLDAARRSQVEISKISSGRMSGMEIDLPEERKSTAGKEPGHLSQRVTPKALNPLSGKHQNSTLPISFPVEVVTEDSEDNEPLKQQQP